MQDIRDVPGFSIFGMQVLLPGILLSSWNNWAIPLNPWHLTSSPGPPWQPIMLVNTITRPSVATDYAC
jgi:hypothetical protein